MAGTHEGRVLVFPQLTEALTPFDDKPQARKIVDADGGNLTLMELAAGQSWHEHHSVHPIFVQVLKGEVLFHVKDRDITLVPGKPIHVTAKLLHSLRAVQDSTLLVTMLTGESHPEPKIPNPKTLARRRICTGCRGELFVCLHALTYAGENTLTLHPELSACLYTACSVP